MCLSFLLFYCLYFLWSELNSKVMFEQTAFSRRAENASVIGGNHEWGWFLDSHVITLSPGNTGELSVAWDGMKPRDLSPLVWPGSDLKMNAFQLVLLSLCTFIGITDKAQQWKAFRSHIYLDLQGRVTRAASSLLWLGFCFPWPELPLFTSVFFTFVH